MMAPLDFASYAHPICSSRVFDYNKAGARRWGYHRQGAHSCSPPVSSKRLRGVVFCRALAQQRFNV